MEKINDLKGFNKYFCSECEHFHIRKYKYKIDKNGARIKTKDTPFFNHKEFAYKLTDSELWLMKMSKSLSIYSIKSHKKTVGSRKQ